MAANIVHGTNVVTEALSSGRRVNRLYLARDGKVRDERRLTDLAKAAGATVEHVPLAKLNQLTQTQDHQGVAASISPIEYGRLEDLLASAGPTALVLALDQVQHPRNLGMLIRTAAAAGADGLLLPGKGGALVDDTVLRTSAGTVFRLPLITCPNLTTALRQLKKEGWWVFGLDGDGESDVFRMDWPDRCVIVTGNESSGLRPGIRKVCDALLRIPLAKRVESLNAGVATGIALFQVVAQRGQTPR